MRYRLATYRECKAHREWNTTCPDCGRKGKFSPYIDIATMQPVDDKRCGRCCREKSCAYHMTPSEWFKEHPTEKREWLPREQYVELMRQRRREAEQASLSYPLRTSCSSPCQGDSAVQESADSPIAERNTAEEVTKKNCPSETGGRAK